jgi:hypothetical protein
MSTFQREPNCLDLAFLFEISNRFVSFQYRPTKLIPDVSRRVGSKQFRHIAGLVLLFMVENQAIFNSRLAAD